MDILKRTRDGSMNVSVWVTNTCDVTVMNKVGNK